MLVKQKTILANVSMYSAIMLAVKHVVVGTAGHIDHGKSALVHRLTGTDPDRLKEEKERGITIELGFAFLMKSSNLSLAFVDVPGHERFIKNMLAGIGGIDLVLLIVAADESVMPQTREHFDICRLLNVRKGVIVLTKCDLVDKDLRELAGLEVRELVKGSFLDRAPLVEVSARTGEGFEELQEILFKESSEAEGRYLGGLFRLPVDRVFSMKGFGTVVTGTILSGSIRKDDEIEILPRGGTARVRSVQVNGEVKDIAGAGQRAALNLQGVDITDVERGDALAMSGEFAATHMLDAELDVLAGSPVNIKDLTRVHLHVGTAQVLARVRVLGNVEQLEPGDRGIVQLRLERSVVSARGDRFILRRYSPLETIAGGVVLDAFPEKHVVQDSEVVDSLRVLRDADLAGAAQHFISEVKEVGISESQLIRRLCVGCSEIQSIVSSLMAVSDSPRIFVAPEVVASLENQVKEELIRYQKKNPLLEGMPKSELRERIFARSPSAVFEWVLGKLAVRGAVRIVKDLIATKDHSIRLSPEETTARDFLIKMYRTSGWRPKNLGEIARSANCDLIIFERIQKVLIKDGTLFQIAEGMVFHRDALEDLKRVVRAEKVNRNKFDVSSFKAMLGITRKHAIPLLEWLDRERVTRRSGNERVIL